MINKVTLLGRVGKDPVIKDFQNGGKVCSFSLATSESWKNKETNERETSTEWHNIQCYNALAEFAHKYVGKGGRVYLEGKIVSSTQEKDGIKTKYVNITANVIKPLDIVKTDIENKGNQAEFKDDDIPF